LTLKVSTHGEAKALALRDHLLPIVRRHGILEDLDHKDGSLRLLVLEQRPWRLVHWTPFNALAPTEAASPGYRHALARQHARPDLPYGLDVWHDGANVLRLLWAGAGTFEVVSFVRGAWEDAALAM
jgi:hypothetical protein